MHKFCAGERIVVSYVDAGNNVNALPYSVAWVTGDGDNLLEAGEMAEIAINVGGLDPALAGGGSFHIEVRPPRGSHLVIRRNVPPGNALDRVINLN